MAATERPSDRGRREGRSARLKLGQELRLARVAAALSQREVARAAGVSHTTVYRLEQSSHIASLPDIGATLAVVGLKLRVAVYPLSTAHRDVAHAALLSRVNALLHQSWDWATEVPFPNTGDLRSWDAIARGHGVRVAFEAETGPRDGQELQRRLAGKRRDGWIDHLVLVLSDTRGNRAFLRDYRSQLETAFPLRPRALRAALTEGRDPGGSGILVL